MGALGVAFKRLFGALGEYEGCIGTILAGHLRVEDSMTEGARNRQRQERGLDSLAASAFQLEGTAPLAKNKLGIDPA